MREILFRAKEIIGNKWVYGGYFKKIQPCGRVDHIIHTGREERIIKIKTLCQSTGKVDKKGNIIYERDIVNQGHGDYVKRVFYCERHDGFFASPYNDGSRYLLYASKRIFTVIGNEIDNPDLVGEKICLN